MVIFEVPTGVLADTRGRRFSFMLGAATLLVSTLLYLAMWQLEAPFVGWALASILLGLGFTFFSGATEAWLVDALGATGFRGNLETVFGRGQMVGGAAMLIGSVLGGVVAQFTSLGMPYVLRALMLGLALAAAALLMRDLGFVPQRGKSTAGAVREVVRGSIEGGLRNRPVRWLMLAAPFTGGVGIFAFYAMQPYLLELYGQPDAYSIAGLAAAIVAGAQIAGGLAVSRVRRFFRRRTDALLLAAGLDVAVLVGIAAVGWWQSDGLAPFFVAVLLLVVWALVSALQRPIRQAFINGVIPSEQRATVLSFDSAHELGRRRRRAAGPGSRGGRLRLRGVLPRVRRRQRAGDPVRVPGADGSMRPRTPSTRGHWRPRRTHQSTARSGIEARTMVRKSSCARRLASRTGPSSIGRPSPADIVETKVNATTRMPAW